MTGWDVATTVAWAAIFFALGLDVQVTMAGRYRRPKVWVEPDDDGPGIECLVLSDLLGGWLAYGPPSRRFRSEVGVQIEYSPHEQQPHLTVYVMFASHPDGTVGFMPVPDWEWRQRRRDRSGTV